MAFQTVEMRKLTNKLDAQTEEYLEIQTVYETKRDELMQALEEDNIDRLQEYDLMIFKCAVEDKQKAYKNIQITRAEIKQRELYERAEKIPHTSPEYYAVFIAYWEQTHLVYSLKNSEYAANRYRHVVDHQIMMAKHKLEKMEATA